ncbi:MAG: 2-dehydropantoate 2-reductase [Chloroflexi bacterium]|nr:2-dehydropantoate 2-reductase [Chloroflexota bacterium]|tara:strand:+ start:31183 stop:32154 length:972 start_codon:yes stop_codon:yes gene_type:complete
MKFAIIGAGAIGGYIALKLYQIGEEVHLIARGKTYDIIKNNGIEVIHKNGILKGAPLITNNYNNIGPVDYLFLTVKAHNIIEIGPKIAPLISKKTSIISTQNGIPWWYFYYINSKYRDLNLKSLNPNGIIDSWIPKEQIIGSIIYPSVIVKNPGTLEHIEGNRISIGKIDNNKTESILNLNQILNQASFKTRIQNDIRNELWLKLLGNIFFNPVSALTNSTLEDIVKYKHTNQLAYKVMEEAYKIANKLDVKIPVSIAQRISGAGKVGPHKTSMLQDLESKRPMEIEPILGSIIELAKIMEIQIPHIETLYSCIKLLDKNNIQ